MCTKPECQLSLVTVAGWVRTNSVFGGVCSASVSTVYPARLHSGLDPLGLDHCYSLLNKACVSSWFYRPLPFPAWLHSNLPKPRIWSGLLPARALAAASPVLLRLQAFTTLPSQIPPYLHTVCTALRSTAVFKSTEIVL